MRTAGIPPISTVNDPIANTSGGPAHVHIPPTTAAGMLPIITVTPPGGKTGPPTCGTTPVTMGQTCISPTRAAGCPIVRASRSRFGRPKLRAFRDLDAELDE